MSQEVFRVLESGQRFFLFPAFYRNFNLGMPHIAGYLGVGYRDSGKARVVHFESDQFAEFFLDREGNPLGTMVIHQSHSTFARNSMGPSLEAASSSTARRTREAKSLLDDTAAAAITALLCRSMSSTSATEMLNLRRKTSLRLFTTWRFSLRECACSMRSSMTRTPTT